jgi:hypothetical protein
MKSKPSMEKVAQGKEKRDEAGGGTQVYVGLEGELGGDKKKGNRKEGLGVVEREDKAQSRAADGGCTFVSNIGKPLLYHTVRTCSLTFMVILSERFSQNNSLYTVKPLSIVPG